MQIACAEMTDFVKPTRLGFPTIEFLEPGKEWRHAEMRLTMELSFISDRSQGDDNGQPRDRLISQSISPLGDIYGPSSAT